MSRIDRYIGYFTNGVNDHYPFLFIDVGAMGGIALKWSRISKIMKVIAFEPDSREFDKLKNNDRIKYLNYALSDRSQDLRYYVTKGHGLSSLYKPNKDFLSQYPDCDRFHVVREEVISSSKVRSLDDICEENHIKDADFVKLDTQGSELPILMGGERRFVPLIFGAQIEVEFAEMYKNQPLFWDVNKFMADHGFVLMDLKRQCWKRKEYCDYLGKGSLIFGDALYFKKIDVFCREISGFQDKSYGKSKIFKGILTCMVYKMSDYAVSLARAGFENGYLKEGEFNRAVLMIKKYSDNVVFPFLYGKLYKVANFILRRLKGPSYLGWADGDDVIGNIRDI